MKKLYIFISCCLGVIGFIDTSHATSYMEKNYPNLYVEWVTFGDIYRFRRWLIRQTRLKDSILYGCTLTPAPTILYNLWKEGDISLNWFLNCKWSENQVVGASLYNIRSGERDVLLVNPLTFKDNTEFNPKIHTGITIMREYLNFPLAKSIQYYSTVHGLFMVIRSADGTIINSRSSWLHNPPVDELESIKNILWDKWYHP